MTKKTNQTKTRRGPPGSATKIRTIAVRIGGVPRWGQRNSFRAERWRRLVSVGPTHPAYTNFVRVHSTRPKQSKLKFSSQK